MAWLSVGVSNVDLCEKLQEHDILEEGPILQAFLATDRGDFVPEEDRYKTLCCDISIFALPFQNMKFTQ
jgi:hypothetical protein